MQPRVKQKQGPRGDTISSAILTISVLLMVSLIVNCSSAGIKGKSPARQMRAGDYFGGTSASVWSPKKFVPREIENKSLRISREQDDLE